MKARNVSASYARDAGCAGETACRRFCVPVRARLVRRLPRPGARARGAGRHLACLHQGRRLHARRGEARAAGRAGGGLCRPRHVGAADFGNRPGGADPDCGIGRQDRACGAADFEGAVEPRRRSADAGADLPHQGRRDRSGRRGDRRHLHGRPRRCRRIDISGSTWSCSTHAANPTIGSRRSATRSWRSAPSPSCSASAEAKARRPTRTSQPPPSRWGRGGSERK